MTETLCNGIVGHKIQKRKVKEKEKKRRKEEEVEKKKVEG